MSEALTWTVDGKVDLSWEDLELPGHPEGCRQEGNKIALGSPTARDGRNRQALELCTASLHLTVSFFGARSLSAYVSVQNSALC